MKALNYFVEAGRQGLRVDGRSADRRIGLVGKLLPLPEIVRRIVDRLGFFDVL